MTERELRKVANDFVKGFGKVERMCYLLSPALQGYLHTTFGIKTKLIQGIVIFDKAYHGHYWLELENGKILDPTAGQFQNPMTLKVFLGKQPENYHPTEMRLSDTTFYYEPEPA